MIEPFSHGVVIECPECPPFGTRNRRHRLECSERNYSGCGVDIGTCPECGQAWEVSFRVDKLTRAPEYDVPPRAIREAEEAADDEQVRLAMEREERREYERLKAKYGDDGPGADG